MIELGIKHTFERWHKYFAVDDSGKAFLFHKKPVKVKGHWVPSEFRDQNLKSCEKVDEQFDDFSGLLFKRVKKRKQNCKWKCIK